MKYDFLVVGSGFGGSILSAILSKAGNKVLMIDRDHHPRFAVGESSTPISDATLAYLSDQHGIPELRKLAAYGSWRASFPNLRCGLKRGFSYFAHSDGQPYCDNARHEHSCFVAASISDEYSDTHWLRSDTDAFFVTLSQKHGTTYRPNTTIGEMNRGGELWRVELISNGDAQCVEAPWIIDATGHGGFSRQRLNAGNLDHELHTKARTIFGHFQDFGRMSDLAREHTNYVLQPNFDPDNAAQHHILHNGWIWVLRFDNSLTSVGLVTTDFQTPLEEQWYDTIQRYPTFAQLLRASKLVDTTTHQIKPTERLFRTEGMIAKLNARAIGDGWVALPNAFGFIDPLHSTGIAHNLTGIRRLTEIFAGPASDITHQLQNYEQRIDAEVRWIDELVGLCYSGLPNTRLFMDLSNAYFVAVIAQEKANTASRHVSDDFLSVSNMQLRHAMQQLLFDLERMSPEEKIGNYAAIRRRIQQTIAPWNSVDLLSELTKNRISHSAVAKWQMP